MAQTIAEMMVEIGADISQFEKSAKEVQKDMKGMGSSVSGIAKEMGKSVQGFSDTWSLMSQEMKQAYQESQAVLRPFKQDLLGIEHDYFKLAKGMKDYQGTNQDFMNEVAELGKRHKKVTEEMMKNNDFMKQSFIETVGTMVNRSGQSEKIAANFTKMNNPLYTVNNGLLNIGSNLERMARNGNASVLALKLLGPTANMKELNDMTMMINRGLMRMSMLALGMGIVFGIATVAVGKLAYALNEELKPATDEMSSVWKKVFEPLATVFGAVLLKIIEFTTWVGNLINKFNEAHPVLAAMIQSFGYLFLGLMVILSPLAIGIGLFGGLQAALSAVWLLIGPFVTGLLAVAGTAAIVAASIVAVGAVLYLLWTRTTWFKDAVITAWNSIKSAAVTVWNAIYNNAIKPAIEAIVTFVMSQVEKVRAFWDENGAMILQATKNVWNVIYNGVIKPIMTAILAVFKVLWPIIKALVVSTWNAIKLTIQGAINVVLGIIKFFSALFTGNWKALWEATKQILKGVVQFILGFVQLQFLGGIVKGVAAFGRTIFGSFKGIWSNVSSAFTSGASKVFGIVKGGLDKVVSFIKGLGDTFFNAGKGLIDMMAKGISNAASKVLSTVKDLAGKVRDFLPFSPAKTGPLSDLDKLDFGGPIADSIDKGLPKVKSLLNDMLTLSPIGITDDGSNGNTSNTKNYNVTVNGNEGNVAKQIVRELRRMEVLYG